ncbi:4-hydroxybenzoate octaprenyltransferase [Motiliproteus sp. SC1-56]|uniref:4-hydroxybenzoate octaprenyltransferase n=1 Tax=Motiliproteus sp. SC1-56 TaxID=2799565 RepID=UPI001A8E7D6D|nr:4-hydroxybenzoate octaprenyltransferase [Motiliproteus sp. SC1-56]
MDIRRGLSVERLRAWMELTRLNRPIGIYLLLWPTYWALWVAAEGVPALHLLIIFTLGVVLMRSAGCVINDFADRHLDGHVKRTRGRPLPSGRVTVREVIGLFFVLCLSAFVLVLFTDRQTVLLSFGGVALATAYPFMKRYTYLPQVVLGAAFSWAVPMAFSAQSGEVPAIAWLIYAANLLWTVAYDTLYGMVDRDDDLKIGIKSTAILFGDADRVAVGVLQGLVVLTLLLLGAQLQAGVLYYSGVTLAALLFGYQQYLIRHRTREGCFEAFLNNHWVGALVFAGLSLDYLLRG